MLETFKYSEQLTFKNIIKKAEHKVDSNIFVNSYNIVELNIDVFNKVKNITTKQRFFALHKSDYENIKFYNIPAIGDLLILPKTLCHFKLTSLKLAIKGVDALNLRIGNGKYSKDELVNKQGFVKFVEVNAWEKESWKSYISLYNRTDEEISLLKEFAKIVETIEFEQYFGTSKFRLNANSVFNKSFAEENIYTGGYKYKDDELFEEPLNIDLLKESLSYTKRQMIDLLYKGGISKLFITTDEIAA